MSTDDTELGTDRRALEDLLTSEGWPIFKALIDKEWGAEPTLQKVEAAIAQVARGDQAAINDTVQQIQACRREVLKALELPREQLRILKGPSVRQRLFAGHRRA